MFCSNNLLFEWLLLNGDLLKSLLDTLSSISITLSIWHGDTDRPIVGIGAFNNKLAGVLLDDLGVRWTLWNSCSLILDDFVVWLIGDCGSCFSSFSIWNLISIFNGWIVASVVSRHWSFFFIELVILLIFVFLLSWTTDGDLTLGVESFIFCDINKLDFLIKVFGVCGVSNNRSLRKFLYGGVGFLLCWRDGNDVLFAFLTWLFGENVLLVLSILNEAVFKRLLPLVLRSLLFFIASFLLLMMLQQMVKLN